MIMGRQHNNMDTPVNVIIIPPIFSPAYPSVPCSRQKGAAVSAGPY